MQHNPDKAFLIALQFDEVVAAAQRADLLGGGHILTFHHCRLLDVEILRHKCFILSGFVMLHTHRDALADIAHDDLAQRLLREVLHTERTLHRAHSATDVNPDRIRDDHAFRS